MKFDYSKLRGKIREVFATQEAFAKAMNMGKVSLSQRLNNLLEFTQQEILLACRLLGIQEDEIAAYFFTLNVQKDGQPHKHITH